MRASGLTLRSHSSVRIKTISEPIVKIGIHTIDKKIAKAKFTEVDCSVVM